MNLTRIYKYNLQPTPIQQNCLNEAGIKSKILWNRLCGYTFWAIRECENGRRASVINEYINLIKNKKLTGQRAAIVNELSKENDITKEEALKQFIKSKTEKDITIARRKDNTRYLRYSNKHLARLYASEKINSIKDSILKDGSSQIWYGILQKWEEFCKAWEKGNKGKPRFKKGSEISAIQKQINNNVTFNFGEYVNLTWCGSPCLENVKVIVHRELPPNSTIKQIALVKDSISRWYVCVFVQADETIFVKKFNKTDKFVGIDPNMSTCLVTSDAGYIKPKGITTDKKNNRKLKKLQRKLDNQMRLNNPHCYNTDGTWIKGKKIKNLTKGMFKTNLEIAKIKKSVRDTKSNYQHLEAINLLNNYDVIGFGKTKIHNLIGGEGKSKRAQNTKIREHSISQFVQIIKDKSKLSLTPKYVYDSISEVNTTKKCHCCGELSGPTDLNIREWICSKCNTSHNRDVNAGINIKNNTILFHNNEMIKMAEAQSVNSDKTLKVRG